MSNNNSTLSPLAPFANLPFKSIAARGVIACGRDGLGLVSVLVRKGRRAELAQRLRERLGLEWPQGLQRTTAGDVAWIATGPESAFATQEAGGNRFFLALKQTIGDLASLSDQSDGYAVLRLRGPRVRVALAKLIPIDLHPDAFKVGAVASSVAAHMGITVWRLADHSDGSAVFEIAVFRSFAADFWHELAQSAAEFGLVLEKT